MAYWDTKEFQELQQYWYARLAETGFVDAEEDDGLFLRQYHGPVRYNRTQDTYDWFAQLRSRAHTEEFENGVDRIVITEYANGSPIKEIMETLKQHGYSRARNSIRFIIRRYAHKWGIRRFTKSELNQR